MVHRIIETLLLIVLLQTPFSTSISKFAQYERDVLRRKVSYNVVKQLASVRTDTHWEENQPKAEDNVDASEPDALRTEPFEKSMKWGRSHTYSPYRGGESRQSSGCSRSVSCDEFEDYRSADGSCNNVFNPLWGASGLPFRRYLPSVYEDGKGVPRGEGRNPPLPSPRKVSVAMSGAAKPTNTDGLTIMTMHFGQFIDHDLFFTPESDDTKCCSDFKNLTITSAACRPIDVRNDTFYGPKNINCLPFIRSFPANSSCVSGPREQINELTQYVDASQIYGSTLTEANSLRTFVNGQLKVGPGNETGTCPAICPLSFLPVRQGPNNQDQFFAGDRRAEEQPALTSMHTIFLRCHNDIARVLSQNYPFSDEDFYQEARRIVSAIVQQIAYGELLPAILGATAMNTYKLSLIPATTDAYESGYKSTINTQSPNILAVAAFRMGHSFITDNLVMDNITVLLEKSFNNHNRTIISGSHPSDFMKGGAAQQAEGMDHFMVQAVTNKLFAVGPNFTSGSDLLARNIQRARDHGIPPYNEWRKFCNLSSITSFSNLSSIMPSSAATAFTNTYASPADIDVFPALIAEDSKSDGVVGPTLTCLIGKYFQDLKYGDRFWFENGDQVNNIQPRPFSLNQLRSIHNTKLSTLICGYTKVTKIQRNVFKVAGTGNAVEACSEILKLGVLNDITLW